MFDRESVPFEVDSELDRRKRLVLIGLGVMAAVFGIVATLSFSFSGASATFAFEPKAQVSGAEETDANVSPTEKTIVVHVLGCVQHPGVYDVADGSRVSDVVEVAGGMTADASQEAVNLAAKVADGVQIVIPSKDEYQAGKIAADETSSAVVTNSASQAPSGKVNINTASADQLQTLSGIGQATAAKIISYREKNGPFKSIDDLTNVSGIGEKRLESLRSFIAV